VNNSGLSNICETKKGLATSDNNRFLRLWYEVNLLKIGFNLFDNSETIKSHLRWFPLNKGGEYRRWYGNHDYIINWENDGYEIRNFRDNNGKLLSRPQNTQYNCKNALTWSKITTSLFSARFSYGGFIFDDAAAICFHKDRDTLKYVLGFLNSKCCQMTLSILNPTINVQIGDIGNLPMKILEKQLIIGKVNECICIVTQDWDFYETSWDFKYHPLIKNYICDIDVTADSRTISDSYHSWVSECEQRFLGLKANEEELNRIFIDIYGLQDELTPEVLEKDVTVHRVYYSKEDVPESMKGSAYIRTKRYEIVSLLSYAIGCMFGRYSLDTEGLAYAGGEWDETKYITFKSDTDNIIPLTDEEYLEDDIITRLCTWLKVVYGDDTLEENLDFIAKALGNKGNTSREIIRNYFLNDFFKDHCQTYSVTGSGKRPIYWLSESGKQNGFKALIYLHRYNADTVGNLRIDYLHRMQRIYESEIGRMQDTIDHISNAREVAAATKRKEKLQKQLKECREYDEKIAHLALSRTELDPDDGIKVNYRKLQTAADGKFYEVLSDSKNIMSKK